MLTRLGILLCFASISAAANSVEPLGDNSPRMWTVTLSADVDGSGTAGIEPSSAPMFIVMQLIGAVLAYGLIRFIYPHNASETNDD